MEAITDHKVRDIWIFGGIIYYCFLHKINGIDKENLKKKIKIVEVAWLQIYQLIRTANPALL